MGLSGLSYSFPALISAEYISLRIAEEGVEAFEEMLRLLRTVREVGGEVEFFSTRTEGSPASEEEVNRLIEELEPLEESAWLSVLSEGGKKLLTFSDIGIRVRVSLTQFIKLMEIARENSSRIDRLGRYTGEELSSELEENLYEIRYGIKKLQEDLGIQRPGEEIEIAIELRWWGFSLLLLSGTAYFMISPRVEEGAVFYSLEMSLSDIKWILKEFFWESLEESLSMTCSVFLSRIWMRTVGLYETLSVGRYSYYLIGVNGIEDVMAESGGVESLLAILDGRFLPGGELGAAIVEGEAIVAERQFFSSSRRRYRTFGVIVPTSSISRADLKEVANIKKRCYEIASWLITHDLTLADEMDTLELFLLTSRDDKMFVESSVRERDHLLREASLLLARVDLEEGRLGSLLSRLKQGLSVFFGERRRDEIYALISTMRRSILRIGTWVDERLWYPMVDLRDRLERVMMEWEAKIRAFSLFRISWVGYLESLLLQDNRVIKEFEKKLKREMDEVEALRRKLREELIPLIADIESNLNTRLNTMLQVAMSLLTVVMFILAPLSGSVTIPLEQILPALALIFMLYLYWSGERLKPSRFGPVSSEFVMAAEELSILMSDIKRQIKDFLWELQRILGAPQLSIESEVGEGTVEELERLLAKVSRLEADMRDAVISAEEKADELFCIAADGILSVLKRLESRPSLGDVSIDEKISELRDRFLYREALDALMLGTPPPSEAGPLPFFPRVYVLLYILGEEVGASTVEDREAKAVINSVKGPAFSEEKIDEILSDLRGMLKQGASFRDLITVLKSMGISAEAAFEQWRRFLQSMLWGLRVS
mgnify:CR=1 FL=1